MKVRWYPHYLADQPNQSAEESLRKDLRKRTALLLRVERFLKRVEKLDSLDTLYACKDAYSLDDGLEEFRIPKQAKGGVVRIYFCRSHTEPGTLYLLEAELKKGEPRKIDTARAKLKRYREDEKRKPG